MLGIYEQIKNRVVAGWVGLGGCWGVTKRERNTGKLFVDTVYYCSN